MGAARGGVFFLNSITVSINLEKVKLLFNTASIGLDIYCSVNSDKCMLDSTNPTIDSETCSTNLEESAYNNILTTTNFNRIPECTDIKNPCEVNPGECKTSCVRF
jgi:hypothetical protein